MVTMTATATATAYLSLMKIENLGRATALSIVDGPIAETDPAGGFDALEARVYRSRAFMSKKISVSRSELRAAWTKSVEQLDQGSNDGILAHSYHDLEYPERLRNIPDPPAVLFVKGKPDGFHAKSSLAVVGTREPTPFGAKAARSSARAAVERGFAVVSGLAHGCDAMAHEGCIDAEGVGVAVLAHGLDMVYPAANRGLAKLLLEHGGCLASEYPIGAKPIRSAFAERDRIQSGLSDAVLVIETDVGGGTMHTAKFACAQKRKLACIAHAEECIKEDKAKGNQKLIHEYRADPIPDIEALESFLDRLNPVNNRNSRNPASNSEGNTQLSFEF